MNVSIPYIYCPQWHGTGPIGYCTETTHFLVSEKPISLFDLRFPRIVLDKTRRTCPRNIWSGVANGPGPFAAAGNGPKGPVTAAVDEPELP